MRGTETVLCAIPRECWDKAKLPSYHGALLQGFLRKFESIQRRLAKNIAAEDESLRLQRVYERIEQVTLSHSRFAATATEFRACLAAGRFPAISVGSEYTDLLRLAQLETAAASSAAAGDGVGETGVGETVYSPRLLDHHLPRFKSLASRLGLERHAAIRHRVWFIEQRVRPAGCGLVEIPDALSVSRYEQQQSNPSAVDGRGIWNRLVDYFWPTPPPDQSSIALLEGRSVDDAKTVDAADWAQYGVGDRGVWMVERLRSQIEAALLGQGAINLVNQRHNMATELLQQYIHVEQGRSRVLAPVQYGAGHLARPFPLRCLSRLPSEWAPTRELHVGLVSMRHLPIDQYIDVNWYRNVEVPSHEGMAQADEFCFQFSLTQLRELLGLIGAGRLRMHVYHSGFVPAVVGFYRALATLLAEPTTRAGSLRVIPKLKPLPQGRFEEGRPWPE